MNSIESMDLTEIIDKNIFELLQLQDLPNEDRSKLMVTMMQTIQQRVLGRLLDHLNDDEIKQFEALIDSSEEEQTNQFLAAHQIDLAQLTAEEVLRYKTELMDAARSTKTE